MKKGGCGHDAFWCGDEETFRELGLKNLEVIRVDHIDEVLKIALLPKEEEPENQVSGTEGTIVPLKELTSGGSQMSLPS